MTAPHPDSNPASAPTAGRTHGRTQFPGSVAGGAALPPRDRFFPGISKQLANYAAIASLGLGAALPEKADAALYHTGTAPEAPLAMGLQFQGDALAFRIYSPLFGPGQANGTATFYNSRYALAAKHSFSIGLENITGIEVADGTNYLTDRGNVMPISGVIFHPTLDLAILQFDQPFYAADDKVIGIAGIGDITYSAGFGTWGTPAIGTTRDGGLRAWDAKVASFVQGESAPYYQTTTFGYGDTDGLALNARAANGDSGGPVFNTIGELIGINKAASTSIAELGDTTYLALGEPSTNAWIQANTAIVPEPSTVAYGLVGAVGLLFRRRHRVSGAA